MQQPGRNAHFAGTLHQGAFLLLQGLVVSNSAACRVLACAEDKGGRMEGRAKVVCCHSARVRKEHKGITD